MTSFNGKYAHAIDHKGRVSLPARFRQDGRSRKYMLLGGIDKCLLLFTKPEWDRMVEDQSSPAFFASSLLRKHQRFLGANSSEVSLDKQGRITIPSHLLEAAALNKEALIVGAINWIEIWDPDEYKKFEKSHSFEEDSDKAFDTVQELKRGRR